MARSGPDRIKALLFGASLLPLMWLFARLALDDLGANPVETVNRFLGDWSIRFLLIALAVTPIRTITGWNRIARYRRMFGLFAFFHVMLHVLSYVMLDQFFHWPEIWADIQERMFITVGFAAFLMLIPLAVTSTDGMARKLGGVRWRLLHRLAYVAGIAAVIHFFMMVKADVTEPVIYGAILAALFAARLFRTQFSRKSARAA